MRLGARLVLVFGGLAAVSMAGLGATVRYERQSAETARFAREVARACDHIRAEVERDAVRDRLLVENSCKSGELVDRVAIAVSRGDLAMNRTRFSQLVPENRAAFGLDELLLGLKGGDIVGADPREVSLLPPAAVDRLFTSPPAPRGFELRTVGELATVVRCTKSAGSHVIGLIGTRHVAATSHRLENELGVGIRLGAAAANPAPPEVASATCVLDDGAGHSLTIAVDRSKSELQLAIANLSRAVLAATLVAVGMALLLAVILARSLGRPLAQLAIEARKVKSGDAKPLRVAGSGEVRELVLAFDTMLNDLAEARTRLAAASRLAAWREVAKRVAHEVKNPLAPIRAAVETLRRLRARQDPAFDEYFDEASRTVLDEVHRISTIVTEFTRFARLPPPHPKAMDVAEVVRSVVSLHEHTHPKVKLIAPKSSTVVTVEADRDQVVQILTNLVQNACDATASNGGGNVALEVLDGDPMVKVIVRDDGAGLAPGFEERLFVPYATTKESGTGLGLAISQRIAHEHGGDLRYVGAAPGARGATFELTLPKRFGGPLL